MVAFDYLGHDLNRYGSFLDGIQNCIQNCLHHTVLRGGAKEVPLKEISNINLYNEIWSQVEGGGSKRLI